MSGDDFLAYGDTAGFVNVDTSRDRAISEAEWGVASARAKVIMHVLSQTPDGMTWKELSNRLNMHHGQVSGALSNLHKLGHVFMLKEKRDRSHPYVLANFRHWYDGHERIDSPTRTRASLQREAEMAVIEAAVSLVECQLFPDEMLAEAVNRLKEVRGNA